ncbi:MAG: type II secretion system protein GspN [Myxococcota bacterium]|nr:type II secretion system protein GspN [Myxococcota bacterium]
MKRRLILIPLFGLFFGAVFFCSFWLLLPWDRVQQLVAGKVLAATGYQLEAEEFGAYWFSGIEAENVVLSKPLTPEQKAAQARARKEAQAAREKEKAGAALPPPLAGGADAGLSGPSPLPGTAQPPGQEPSAAPGGAVGEPAAGSGEAPKPAPAAAGPVLPPPIRIQHLAARLAILPLFLGRLQVDFVAELAGGTLEGSIGKRGEAFAGEIEARDLRIAGLPKVGELLGVPLKGSLALDGELLFDPEEMANTKGTIELTLSGLELGAGSIPLPKGAIFPTFELTTPTKVGTLNLLLVVGEEVAREPNRAIAHLQTFEHEGADLEFKAEGDLLLAPSLGASRPDLTLGVRFAPDFVERNHLGVVLNSGQVKRYLADDFLGISLRGTFQAPEPRLVAPAWGKARPYLRAAPGAPPPAKAKAAPSAAGRRPAAAAASAASRAHAATRAARAGRPVPPPAATLPAPAGDEAVEEDSE